MTNVSAQQKDTRLPAMVITLLIHGALFLLLYFFIIKTPLPAFPPEPEGKELGLDFGTSDVGSGNTENNNMGETKPNPNIAATSTPTKQQEQKANESNEDVVKSNDAESVSLPEKTKKENKKTKKEKTEEVKPAPVPQPDQNLLNALSVFRNKKANSNTGGDGDGKTPGNVGDPNGTPDGDGPGGPGKGGGGTGGVKYDLSGRRIATPPFINDNSQDQGKVVVNIIVNENGKVIKAEPGGRGSTTSSPELFSKARQAAYETTFNSSPDGTKE